MEKTERFLIDFYKSGILKVIITGLILRVLFSLYGGPIYFGKEDFRIQGDTLGWIDSIMNLILKGEYTSDLDEPNARFFRPPGYSMLIGLFYFLCSKNLDLALNMLSWFQVFADCVSIWLFFRIGRKIGLGDKTSTVAALLYACYPFIIIWNPVLYAESMSVFFLLSGLYFLTSAPRVKGPLLSGIFIGLAVLTRLQIMFVLPAVIVYLINKNKRVGLLKPSAFFLAGMLVTYGLWPIRNIILHDRFVFSQDLRVGKHWSKDYLAFMDFIFAIKTDHQPQYQQIVENKEVVWPSGIVFTKEDSVLLARTIEMCRNCGTGFSYFKFHAGLISNVVPIEQNCDNRIATNFQRLKAAQIRQNPINHFLLTPLKNLEKAIFKFHLYGKKSSMVKIGASALFLFRTSLIILGIFAIGLNQRKRWFDQSFSFLIIAYTVIWYAYICFVYRNIEIRYLLQCDILLLLPAACIISRVKEIRRLGFNKNTDT